MSAVRVLAGCVLVLSLLGGCSDGGDDASTTTEGVDVNPLAMTEWHLVSMELDGELTEFSGSTVPTIEFTEDRLSMTDGVNTAGGGYRLEGTTFSAGPLASTLIGYLDPPRPEHRLIALVDAASEAVVDGSTLVIRSGDAELTYARGPAEPTPVELENTSWTLTDISSENVSTNATLGPVPAVVTFGEGTVEAYDGLNTATGTYELDGVELSVELDSVSEVPVTGEALPQYQLIELLEQVDGAQLVGEALLLTVGTSGSLRLEPTSGGPGGG